MASWLRKTLSHIRIPRAFQDRSPIRIYIDVAHDRVTADFWHTNIAPALDASRFLLIVATPAVFDADTDDRPNWVRREIDFFAKTPQHSNMVVAHAAEAMLSPLPDEIARTYPRMHYVDLRSVQWPLPRRVSHYFVRDEAIANALTSVAAACLDIEPPLMPAFREEQERYRRQRLTLSVAGLATVSVALIGLTVWALVQQKRALANEQEARRNQLNAVANETRSLAALSIVASERGEFTDALRLALAAWPRATPGDVRSRLETTLQAISLSLRSSQGEVFRLRAPGPLHDVVFAEPEPIAIGQIGDDRLVVWDLRSARSPAKQVSLAGGLRDLRLSHDRRRILARSDDGALRLFDPETLKQVGQPIDYKQRQSDAAFAPTASRLISWSIDGKCQLWDSETGTQIGKDLPHEGSVDGAAFSDSSRYVATWSDKTRSVYVWDSTTGALISGPLENDWLGQGVVFFDHDRRLLSWSNDKAVKVWDLESGRRIGENMLHDGPVAGGVVLNENTRLLAWSSFSDLRLWDLATHQQIGATMKHKYRVDGVTVSADQKTAFSWSGEYLYVWRLDDATAQCPPLAQDGNVSGAVFNNTQNAILVWTEKGHLRLWNTDGCIAAVNEMTHDRLTYSYQSASWETPKPSLPANGIVRVNGAAFSRDDTHILSWSDDGTVRVWNARSGEQLGPARKHSGVVWRAVFFDNDRRVASWATDNTLRVWNVVTGQQRGGGIRTDATALSGALLARNDRAVVYWAGNRLAAVNMDDGSPLFPPVEHWGVRGAVLDRGATKILSWSGTHGTVKLHSLSDGRLLVPEMHHDTAWVEAEFSHDDESVLSWSADAIKVWDAKSGKQIGQSMAYADSAEIQGVAQGSDGGRFVSWSRDGVVKLWDGLNPGKQVGPDIEQGRVPKGTGARLHRGALFLPDGRLLVWGNTEELRVLDSETGSDFKHPLAQGSEVFGAIVSPSGSSLLTWSFDGSIKSGLFQTWMLSEAPWNMGSRSRA